MYVSMSNSPTVCEAQASWWVDKLVSNDLPRLFPAFTQNNNNLSYMFNPQCSEFPPPTHESGWSKLIINWPKLVFNLFFKNQKLVNQLMTSLHQLLTSLDMPTETKYMSMIQESTNLKKTATN